jgi:hypothetical protein
VLAASGRLDAAEVAALALADPQEQSRALSDLARCRARLGQTRHALSLIVSADTAASFVAGPAGASLARCAVAEACAELGEADRAVRIVDAVIASPPPSPAVAVGAARALAIAGRHDRAVALAGGDPAVAAAVAVSTARSGQVGRALVLAASVSDEDRRRWAEAGVALALAEAGAVERAERAVTRHGSSTRDTRPGPSDR